MARRFTAAQLAGGPELVWLLAIPWAGRTYRWSSRPCAPVDGDSEAVLHDGGLPPVTFAEGFSLLSLSPDVRALSLELDFSVDVAEAIEGGHDLASATGELALWRDGDAYEARVVKLLGRVREPEYGAENEPVALTIEQAPWDDAALYPPAAARVGPDTWPTAASAAKGLYYPSPFGTPGVFRDSDGTDDDTSGSPGLVVEWDSVNEWASKVLVAGYEVAAGSVKLRTSDGQSSATGSVTTTTDGLGRTVAVVDISGESNAFRSHTEYWVSWTAGGSLMFDDRSGAILGAGDLLLWMLRRASVPVDVGRTYALRGQLNAYKVAGYIDEAVSPWEWLADNLLPLLPVSLVAGPDGLYPVLWQLDAGPLDAVGFLRAGPGVVRTGPVRYIRGPRDVVNEVRINFAPRARTGEYRRVVVCTPEPDADDPDQFTSHYSRLSGLRVGTQAETIDTDILYDVSTAGLVSERRVRAHALPIRAITYDCGVEVGYLEPGDVVVHTDDELHLNEQVCLVGMINWISEAAIELTLIIVEDPARDG